LQRLLHFDFFTAVAGGACLAFLNEMRGFLFLRDSFLRHDFITTVAHPRQGLP